MKAEYESGNESVLNIIGNRFSCSWNAHTSCFKFCVRPVQVPF